MKLDDQAIYTVTYNSGYHAKKKEENPGLCKQHK